MNTRINLSDIWLKNLLSCLIGNHYEMKVSADSNCLYAEILGALRIIPLCGATLWVLVTIEHDSISFEWGKCNSNSKLPSWDAMAGFFTGMLRACASSLEFDRTLLGEGYENYVKFTLDF